MEYACDVARAVEDEVLFANRAANEVGVADVVDYHVPRVAVEIGAMLPPPWSMSES